VSTFCPPFVFGFDMMLKLYRPYRTLCPPQSITRVSLLSNHHPLPVRSRAQFRRRSRRHCRRCSLQACPLRSRALYRRHSRRPCRHRSRPRFRRRNRAPFLRRSPRRYPRRSPRRCPRRSPQRPRRRSPRPSRRRSRHTYLVRTRRPTAATASSSRAFFARAASSRRGAPYTTLMCRASVSQRICSAARC